MQISIRNEVKVIYMLQSLVYISWLAMVVYFLNFAKQQIFLSSLIGLARYTCARAVAASLVSQLERRLCMGSACI